MLAMMFPHMQALINATLAATLPPAAGPVANDAPQGVPLASPNVQPQTPTAATGISESRSYQPMAPRSLTTALEETMLGGETSTNGGDKRKTSTSPESIDAMLRQPRADRDEALFDGQLRESSVADEE